MANWRSTRTPSIYVAHSRSCPAHEDTDARCRCKPSWRGRRRDPVTGKPTWSKTMKDRGEVLVWLGSVSKGADHLAELAARGPTLGSLGDEWLDGVERGRIGRRRGRGKPYSETTIASMRRRWEYKVRPEFGERFAGELTEMDWQRWIDQLTRQGLSRSSIAQLISLASGIYAWAAAPSRRLVQRNPLRLVELRRTTRSRVRAWRSPPRPLRCWPRSGPRTVSPTRSPSTPASAARSSTASNGPTCSRAIGSRPGST